MKRRRSRTVANLERFRQMVVDLSDSTGAIRGWPYWKLANEFNKRYAETKPINFTTIASYIKQANEAGWLVTRQESESNGVLTFFLLSHPYDE